MVWDTTSDAPVVLLTINYNCEIQETRLKEPFEKIEINQKVDSVETLKYDVSTFFEVK